LEEMLVRKKAIKFKMCFIFTPNVTTSAQPDEEENKFATAAARNCMRFVSSELGYGLNSR